MEHKVHLTYWAVRGMAQYARYTLEAAEVPYEETRYEIAQHEDWFQRDKPASTLLLPNIPNIKDGEVQISEHDTLVRYIAKKYKPTLLGKDDNEQALVDNVFSFLVKQRNKLGEFCYAPNPTEESRIQVIKVLDNQLTKLNAFAEGKRFIFGDELTIADIYFYENFKNMQLIHEETSNSYSNLLKVSQEFEN